MLTPFLLHLLNQGLAKATVRRHRDKLWLLGAMTYRFAGTELRVFVKPRQSVSALIKLDAPPKPLPGFIAGAPVMARAAGTEPRSGNDAFRQAIEKKTQAIAAGR